MNFNFGQGVRRSALLLSVSFLGLLLSLTSVVPAAYAEEDTSRAKVIATEGKVQIKDASGNWIDAKRGTSLEDGAEVSSGEASSCVLAVGEGRTSAVTLQSDSKATLSSLDPVKIKLDSGELIALVKGLKEGSTFQVMSSTAVASVKGTSFYVSDGVIAVLEGSVDVTFANGQTVHLEAGQQVDIASQAVGDISAEIEAEIEENSENVETLAEGETTTTQVGEAEARQNIQISSSGS